MELTRLFDAQVLIYTGLSATVILVILIVQAVVTRRLLRVQSELESLRRDVKLLEEGVKTVTDALQARHH